MISPPRIQLLGTAWSRAFRNVWMLEELGIPYEIINALPASTIVKSFVQSGKIPVLLENENNDTTPSFILYESSAINTYLGDQYGNNKGLVPLYGTKERAIYDQTISCITNELDSQGLWIHRKHDAMKHIFGESEVAVKAAKRNFHIVNEQLSIQLNPYLLGNTFTAADILYVHCLDWSKSINWNDKWPNNINTYRTLCHERIGYQKSKVLRDDNKNERKEKMKEMSLDMSNEKTTKEDNNSDSSSKL